MAIQCTCTRYDVTVAQLQLQPVVCRSSTTSLSLSLSLLLSPPLFSFSPLYFSPSRSRSCVYTHIIHVYTTSLNALLLYVAASFSSPSSVSYFSTTVSLSLSAQYASFGSNADRPLVNDWLRCANDDDNDNEEEDVLFAELVRKYRVSVSLTPSKSDLITTLAYLRSEHVIFFY